MNIILELAVINELRDHRTIILNAANTSDRHWAASTSSIHPLPLQPNSIKSILVSSSCFFAVFKVTPFQEISPKKFATLSPSYLIIHRPICIQLNLFKNIRRYKDSVTTPINGFWWWNFEKLPLTLKLRLKPAIAPIPMILSSSLKKTALFLFKICYIIYMQSMHEE